jgi:hypothetical protein
MGRGDWLQALALLKEERKSPGKNYTATVGREGGGHFQTRNDTNSFIKANLWRVRTRRTGKRLVKKKFKLSMVAHICNLSYSGGRHQEDCGSRLGQTKDY